MQINSHKVHITKYSYSLFFYIFSKKDGKSKLESDLTFLNIYNCHFFMKSYLMRKNAVCSRKHKVEKSEIWVLCAIYTSSMNLNLEVSLYLKNERIGLLQHFQNDVPQSTSARDTFGKKETSGKLHLETLFITWILIGEFDSKQRIWRSIDYKEPT